jgi:hypothetical protein
MIVRPWKSRYAHILSQLFVYYADQFLTIWSRVCWSCRLSDARLGWAESSPRLSHRTGMVSPCICWGPSPCARPTRLQRGVPRSRFDENTDEGLLAGEFSNFANSLITNAIMAARFAQVHSLKYYARHVGLLESRGAHALSEIWRGKWFVDDVNVFRDPIDRSKWR